MVIFGGSGDLARRKLLPALYNLHRDRLLPGSFAVVGVARREMSDEEFVESMREGVRSHSRRDFSDDLWAQIAGGLSYVAAGRNVEDYRKLAAHLERLDRDRGTGGNRLFYLATPPGAFAGIVDRLREAGLHRPGPGGDWARIVLEKPIGRDLASALELNHAVNDVFDEQSVFRIDHYLGKETVQNLLVFRFANAIFEPLWNQKYVDHVQITVAESIGVEGRGGYYEAAGTTRDMVQNHIFQLLCLTAMEPPVSLDANAVRDEKVKVLRALKPIPEECMASGVVRAQYTAATSGGQDIPAYGDEANVAPDSCTETFVAAKIFIDNWRRIPANIKPIVPYDF